MKKSLLLLLLSVFLLSLPVIQNFMRVDGKSCIGLIDTNNENSDVSDETDKEEAEELDMSSILSKLMILNNKYGILNRILGIDNSSEDIDSPPPKA